MSSARRSLHVVGWLLTCWPVLVAGPAASAGEIDAGPVPTEAGRFQVGWESRLKPLAINVMHAWVLSVTRPDGTAVDDATIAVTGGMPEHDHGLPTQPRVTRTLGGGRYLVEGLKFHMNGRWQVSFTITQGGETDRITFDLEL